MVGWVINRSRTVIKRYLNEETYNLIKHGYFAVYKQAGKTSAEELEDVKDSIIAGIKDKVAEDENYLLRAGHGGVLDSMATGVLVVALCDGCKVLPTLLKSNKRYTATARLGIATDSYNSTGNIVAESNYEHVTRLMLENALKEFVGDIWQKPPDYSALKISGRRASDIVRAGKEVNLIPRPVKCYAAHCLEFEPPLFTLDVSCGHGFYIRSLVHDLAQAVGSCGHVTALERTKHGPFTIKDCVQPQDYSLDNIVSAICEAQRKYPKLAQYIENYWKSHAREHSSQKEVKRGYDAKNSDVQYRRGIVGRKSVPVVDRKRQNRY